MTNLDCKSDAETTNNDKAQAIHLLLVDDHPLVRDGLRLRLESLPGLVNIYEADDAASALQIAQQNQLSHALIDINLGAVSGLQLAAQLSEQHPQIGLIMLSMHDRQEYVNQALQAGAKAYVLKDAPAQEIIEAIAAVLRGELYFSSRLKHKPDPSPHNLTQRELCVLHSIATGKSNKHIARDLGLSVRTVETHRLNIKRKLNIEGQADLIRYALQISQN